MSLRPLPSIVLSAAILSACAAPAPEGASRRTAPPAPVSPSVLPPSPEPLPVVRQGRYTLVELAPEAAQRHPMRQIVEVSIPPTLDTSVGEALRHVLQRSGYRLCEAREAETLYALPLPAAHLRLGPMSLRHALLTLAGPAWELVVDEASRRVCFTRMPAAPAGLPDLPGAELAGERP